MTNQNYRRQFPTSASPASCDQAQEKSHEEPVGEAPRYVQNDTADWRSSPSVERWRHGLLHVTGLSPSEAADRLDVLLQFCTRQRVSPEVMIDECRSSPDRTARRTFYLSMARSTQASLVVQSFLVHNGVNVFGDLVCMPSTREGVLREQGEQWSSRRS